LKCNKCGFIKKYPVNVNVGTWREKEESIREELIISED
jgi:hypothetical protein